MMRVVRRHMAGVSLLVGVAIAAGPMPSTANAQQQPPAGCHQSYWGWCVPIGVSDVDCIGGGGDGPYYVGRVELHGPDEYGLDRDGNGIGCESSPTGPLW